MFSKLFFERINNDKKLIILRKFFYEPNLSEKDFRAIRHLKTLNKPVFITFVKAEYPEEFGLINFSSQTSAEFKMRSK